MGAELLPRKTCRTLRSRLRHSSKCQGPHHSGSVRPLLRLSAGLLVIPSKRPTLPTPTDRRLREDLLGHSVSGDRSSTLADLLREDLRRVVPRRGLTRSISPFHTFEPSTTKVSPLNTCCNNRSIYLRHIAGGLLTISAC